MGRLPTRIESIFVISIVLILFAAVRCSADDEIETPAGVLQLIAPLGGPALPELETKQEYLAELRLQSSATFTPLSAMQYRNLRVDNGDSVCIFWTGADEQKLVWLCSPEGAAPFKFIVWVGKPGPGPDPPDPDPDPDLNDRAKYVYDRAKLVNQPAVAAQIADAYASVAAQIGAGTIKTLPQASAAIKAEMSTVSPLDRKWKPLGDALIAAFNEQAQSLADAAKLFRDVADGMRAAS